MLNRSNILTIEANGNFFRLKLETDPTVDPGGNSAFPTTLTLDADQRDYDQPRPLVFKFYGNMEFREFRQAIKDLDHELDKRLGPDVWR